MLGVFSPRHLHSHYHCAELCPQNSCFHLHSQSEKLPSAVTKVTVCSHHGKNQFLLHGLIESLSLAVFPWLVKSWGLEKPTIMSGCKCAPLAQLLVSAENRGERERLKY